MRRFRKLFSSTRQRTLCFALFAWANAACGGGTKATLSFGQPSNGGAAPPAAEGPSNAAAPPPAPADETAAPDPAAKQLFEQTLAVAPATLSPAPAPREVTKLALEHTALQWASGLAPEGEHLQVELLEGQRAAAPLSLPGGSCLTVIAQGSLGVVEVDLFLTERGSPAQHGSVLAQDALVGPIAVVGGAGFACWRAPASGLEADVHVVLRRGQGLVLVRMFRG